jgi:hypothetical protein
MSNLQHPKSVLADMLARSLGVVKAAEIVDVATRQLGLGEALTRADALLVLEQIASQPGIIGVTARFAKSRVHLVWGE